MIEMIEKLEKFCIVGLLFCISAAITSTIIQQILLFFVGPSIAG